MAPLDWPVACMGGCSIDLGGCIIELVASLDRQREGEMQSHSAVTHPPPEGLHRRKTRPLSPEMGICKTQR